MTRNTESRFALNPTRIDMSRSTFDRSSSIKTSFNVGDLIPFYVDEVLPGDTFKIKTSKVVRLQTPITPIMDNMYMDTYWFFVPNRLTWQHWREFCGENTQSAWIPDVEYSIPQLNSPVGGWHVGTIADYMGLPVNKQISVNALPFRAYALICNEWFRDENLQDPLQIPVTDANVAGVNTGDQVTDVAKGGKPFVVAKYHDYFTGCLPAPQKSVDVTIPVIQPGNLPVVPRSAQIAKSFFDGSKYTALDPNGNSMYNLTYDGAGIGFDLTLNNGQPNPQIVANIGGGTSNDTPIISNLWAIQDGTAGVATINQLRMAFQIQKFYERNARGGTRYTEILKSHFGVTSPDSRLQRPEYLGGNRIPININQVIQNSGTVEGETPLGETGAMSLTVDVHSDFTKSFVEHGFVIGLMCVRYDHTYQQGIERFWSRKDIFDYYWPVFANIGEQAVLNKEICASGGSDDDEVFGYQEAWADYRYKPSRVTGEMRSGISNTLDVWHLADYYNSIPALSSEWIREDKTNVDRVLAVQSSVSNQLFADIFVINRTTRPMPMYSIPGLIDHH